MMFTLFGLLLVIPNALTLLTLGLGVVLIQIQVRLEAESPATTHGENTRCTEYECANGFRIYKTDAPHLIARALRLG